eukprot:314767-Pyramimonas_sp.AAC.1
MGIIVELIRPLWEYTHASCVRLLARWEWSAADYVERSMFLVELTGRVEDINRSTAAGGDGVSASVGMMECVPLVVEGPPLYSRTGSA